MAKNPAVAPAFFSRQVVEARRFYLDPRAAAGSRLAVVCGGWERCADFYHLRRETFAYFSLELVVAGQGQLRLAGREHRLGAGSVFSYGPGVAHEITTDAEAPLSKYFVDFIGSGALATLAEGGLSPGTCLSVGTAEGLQETFERLLLVGQRDAPVSARLAALYLEMLPLLVAEAWVPEEARARQAYQTYRRCQVYCEAHFLVVRTAEQVARACHVDVAYMSRLFQRFGKIGPYAYLLRLKMRHAARLLEDGSRPVREVAELLAMDAFQFSRVFRRVHGLSPVAFRRVRAGEGDAAVTVEVG